MTDDDKKLVLVRLTQIAEVFNRTLTRETWLAYVHALDDLPGQTVARALERCLRTCRRFPTPAEVREQTRPDETRPPPRRALPAPSDGPRVTRAQMAAILRDVAPRCAPRLRGGFVAMADDMDAGRPCRDDSPMGRIVAAVEREPGCDDDDETPSRWWDA